MKENEGKGIQIKKEELKQPLCVDGTIIYIENSKESTPIPVSSAVTKRQDKHTKK